MRPFFALTTLLFSTQALAVPALELEVNGGTFGHDFVSAPTPTLGARVGLDIADLVTVSLRGASLCKFDQPTQEFGLLADVRLHSRGRVQFNGGLGLGLAIASFTKVGDTVETGFTTVRPFPLLDVGVRLNLWRFFVGVNVGGWPFTPTWFGTASVGFQFFGD